MCQKLLNLIKTCIFNLLPDDVVSAFTTRGTADRISRYYPDEVREVNKILEGDENNSVGSNIQVTTVLYICDLNLS